LHNFLLVMDESTRLERGSARFGSELRVIV
jgi:hypothetical protein